ncbi:MATE family efflux transporter [Pseudemcibacter aquimaris]|uniref:MATE family efflux transporter n=1 Tax=Pseudemcibacter aquimaris TaxID=2857064 RepID=UPI002011CD2F|nr:MATE family efflux transporter [Pseudemcibacter aquimaris]MCC3860541.1 MATE family efflux transporter [Pseudemcibacter aquimaris]WDU59365.1 MATE family efflux transporter [Pseudemcibacter aquimaris]
MNQVINNRDPINGNVNTVFWRYALPEIIGFLAISSAGFVDAIFLGNYVGQIALATVNLSIPALTTFFAVSMLISVGGSVVCGKLIGRKKREQANAVFTSTIIIGVISALLLFLLSMIFFNELIIALGAKGDELEGMLSTYLGIILLFAPLYVMEIMAFYFIRLDGQPELASGAFIFGAAVNIFLDWLFIAEFGWGIEGAAYATGLAMVTNFVILFPYFFTKYSKLKFTKPMTDIRLLLKAYVNGISEFANEASIGVTVLIFNWVMITRLGTEGVAALSIIDHIWMVGLYVIVGMCDSLQPSISQNFGAGNAKRIIDFMRIAAISSLSVGIIMIIAMIFFPDMLISIFLQEDEIRTREIAAEFLIYIWPAFLFVGLNILLSTYFTSMHKAFQSTVIAFSRSFVLPAICLLILPLWIGNIGMFIALPVAEGVTFLIAAAFFIKRLPQKLIDEDKDRINSEA